MKEHSTIDTAALSAAVVAGAVAVFVSPGPYAWPSLIIGLTMTFLVFGYSGRTKRDLPETLAFASVFAFAFLPILGFTFEAYKTPEILTMSDNELSIKGSQVPGCIVALLWFIPAMIIVFIDRFYQRKR